MSSDFAKDGCEFVKLFCDFSCPEIICLICSFCSLMIIDTIVFNCSLSPDDLINFKFGEMHWQYCYKTSVSIENKGFKMCQNNNNFFLIKIIPFNKLCFQSQSIFISHILILYIYST